MTCCCDGTGLLPISSAKAIIAENANPIAESECVSLSDSLGRILAEDIIANINVPPTNNSAMDGYAFRFDDVAYHSEFRVVGESFAGTPFDGHIHSGECIRIMTGATVPEGCDTVLMQEAVDRVGDVVCFKRLPKYQEAVRFAGEDIADGSVLLAKGTLVTPSHIGAIASIGLDSVRVSRKLRVAIMSTGDEILSPGEPPKYGCIYDSNKPALMAMMASLPIEVIDLGVVADSEEKLEQALLYAASEADVIITSGGVSVGEADYTKDLMERLGQIYFWKIAIKPGKPLAFGAIGDTDFYGLPGNPVSSVVTFEHIVLPALLHKLGHKPQQPMVYTATVATGIKKRAGRSDYQRGICSTDELGQLKVIPLGNQGSGVLTSLKEANCYILLEQDRENVEADDKVKVQMFDSTYHR